jgi:hypothetical protein
MNKTSRTSHEEPVKSRDDEGVALVVALLLMVALSSMGASLLMVAQTETYASMNYRMMSQARYGAESGVLRAVNYITQTYQLPGSGTDPLSNYDMTVSPVTYSGQPVILSADPAITANYPISSVQSAFNTAAQGSLAAGQTVTYNAYATLVSMRTITEYGVVGATVIQTWRITGTGTLGGTRPATVEVSSVLERQVGSAHSFGVFATNGLCGALEFGGGSVVDSYDSGNMTFNNGEPVTQSSGGKAGTNGNLHLNGNATVFGTLSTPRTGVGVCKNGTVNALTGGLASVSEGLIQLPQALQFPTPTLPNPMPPTNTQNISGANCASLGLSAPECTGSTGNITLDPNGGTLIFGNVVVNSGATIHLRAGKYTLNSIQVNGQANFVIDTGPVYLNVAGVGSDEPISFEGGSILNATYNPAMLHILYAGTDNVEIAGGANAAALLYAPNAHVSVEGGADFYGSIVGATVADSGGGRFHYDRRLADDFFVAGNYLMSAFTWKKY